MERNGFVGVSQYWAAIYSVLCCSYPSFLLAGVHGIHRVDTTVHVSGFVFVVCCHPVIITEVNNWLAPGRHALDP